MNSIFVLSLISLGGTTDSWAYWSTTMKFIALLFKPITWAIGFLLPLTAQVLLALDVTTSSVSAYGFAAVVAVLWGLMAHLRGSWIWVK